MEELTISGVAALTGCLALFYSIVRNKQGDNKESLKIMIRIEESIKNINSEFADFKSESKSRVDAIEDDVKELRKQVIINEQSTKSAHHRLDRMDNTK